MTSNTVENVEVFAWDVALEALVREEQQKCGRPLQVADFRRLATTHAIRFDDIMSTLFELVLNERWHYTPGTGSQDRGITREFVEGLYVNRRLNDEDMLAFTGNWIAVDDRPN